MPDLSEKQFLSELAELTQSLQREIEAKKLGLDPSAKAIKSRRRRVLVDQDYWFFATTYFPHHIWGPPSKFQQSFSRRLPQLLRIRGGCREWWVAPRGETKSTLLTKIGPVWIVVQGLLQQAQVRVELAIKGEIPPFNDYVIFLGAETKMPTKLLEVVKTELLHNANLAMDFPEICGQGPTWRVGDAVTRNGIKLEPFGAEQAIRGTFHGASRPKVLLGDDLITDKEAKSPTERDNRWNWLEKAAEYLGPPDGSVKYLGVGTVLNKDDPISRAKHTIGHVVHHFKAIEQLPERMDLWEQCEALMRNEDIRLVAAAKDGAAVTDEALPSFQFYLENKRRMDRGAVTSWPEVRSLYWLMKQRAKNPRAFGTEMQGEARSDEDAVFARYAFWVQRLRHWIYFGGCDPSMGKGETADPSALLVGAFDTESLKLNVVEAAIKRRVPSKLEADLIELQVEYKCQAWGFENNNAYEHMRSSFIDAGIRKKVSLPLVGITATVPQEVRIDSLEPFVCDIDPKILFHARLTQLLEELNDWPEPQSHHHYDGLVALHLLWMIAVSRAGGIPRVSSRARRNDSIRGYDG